MKDWLVLTLGIVLSISASAQSVVSTHSGVVYFFEGSVLLGDEHLEQRFGRFPEIAEGRELRTEQGRAEVLLTPGAFLRIGENSTVRMVSNKLNDTQVELVSGSAILESTEKGAPVRLTRDKWQVRIPESGVFRIDSQPAQLEVYKGSIEVGAGEKADRVTVREGETLPLTAVLVPEPAKAVAGDEFKGWAMNRSQAVSADNATAAGIIDDPSQIENSGMAAAGGLSYFPITGIPALGYYPYGVSFWSPYQSTLSSVYFPPVYYPAIGMTVVRWPAAIHPYSAYPRIGSSLVRRPGGVTSTVVPYRPVVRPATPSSPVRGVVRGGHR
jgi:hypothetical protein